MKQRPALPYLLSMNQVSHLFPQALVTGKYSGHDLGKNECEISENAFRILANLTAEKRSQGNLCVRHRYLSEDTSRLGVPSYPEPLGMHQGPLSISRD